MLKHLILAPKCAGLTYLISVMNQHPDVGFNATRTYPDPYGDFDFNRWIAQAQKEDYPEIEMTHDLWNLTTAQKIEVMAAFPQLLVPVLIRNPVDRAWSQALGMAGGDQKLASSLVIGNAKVSPYNRIDENIGTWADGIEDLHIFFYDDLLINPIQFMGSFCRRVSASVKGIYKSTTPLALKKMVKKYLGDSPIPDGVKAELIREMEGEIKQLGESLNVDLTRWITKYQASNTCAGNSNNVIQLGVSKKSCY